ncbi:phosphopyruvate hydratase [Occultella kanbiaonis]|uniref:phosphopyruvate hydratase n=1 Tax=Occultella kanbiaonis TaxID=2675754 RepID=UPI0013D294F3|nr:phosphopyruvate hydratase [Occultella kanbiaonis]
MSSTEITRVRAWEALDSRGRPTVACRIDLDGGAHAVARVPSGASTGSHEVAELRDGGTRYEGAGVRNAVAAVIDHVGPAVIGLDAESTAQVDRAIAAVEQEREPGTVGANATLAVSLAAVIAAANAQDAPLARMLHPVGPLQLPMPMVNIVSGGAHAAGALDIQDVLVIPEGASTFAEAIEWVAMVRAAATRIALDRGFAEAALVADEGGLGLRLGSNVAALELVAEAVETSGLDLGTDVTIAIDAAATEFYADGAYTLARDGRILDAERLLAMYSDWVDRFPIRSIEDPLAEDDWDGWALATRELGGRIDLVGDDLFVTQADRLKRGVAEHSATAILVKVNQNGLVSRAGDVLRTARDAGFRTIVSARSGETEDSWVADLATGWAAGQLKVGSTHRSERTAKWNRVLELEATEESTLAHPWPRRSKEESA